MTGALLIVAQAWLIADVVSRAFIRGQGPAQLAAPLGFLLAVVLARAAIAWAGELDGGPRLGAGEVAAAVRLAGRGSASSDRIGLAEQSNGELAILATRGIDALDGYFSLYLPQLMLAVIVPSIVIVAVLSSDWISAAIIAFTVPLVPVFMALVGASTRERMDLQLRTLERLAGHFLDVVAGLPTLKVFGRAKAQAAVDP